GPGCGPGCSRPATDGRAPAEGARIRPRRAQPVGPVTASSPGLRYPVQRGVRVDTPRAAVTDHYRQAVPPPYPPAGLVRSSHYPQHRSREVPTGSRRPPASRRLARLSAWPWLSETGITARRTYPPCLGALPFHCLFAVTGPYCPEAGSAEAGCRPLSPGHTPPAADRESIWSPSRARTPGGDAPWTRGDRPVQITGEHTKRGAQGDRREGTIGREPGPGDPDHGLADGALLRRRRRPARPAHHRPDLPADAPRPGPRHRRRARHRAGAEHRRGDPDDRPAAPRRLRPPGAPSA